MKTFLSVRKPVGPALLLTLVTLVTLLASPVARTDDGTALDSASKAALGDTQSMLTTPKSRAEGVKQSAMGPEVDRKVKELGGNSQNTNDIYGLAADVFKNIMQEAGGDPLKAQQLLLEAEQNPGAFAEKWTPEQRAKLNALSGRLPASQPPANSGNSP